MKGTNYKTLVCIVGLLFVAGGIQYAMADESVIYDDVARAKVQAAENRFVLLTVGQFESSQLHTSFYMVYLGIHPDRKAFEENFKENVESLLEEETLDGRILDRMDGASCVGEPVCHTYIGTWTKNNGFTFQYASGENSVEMKTEVPVPTNTVSGAPSENIIRFDDLEISFGDRITWSSVNNKFSDQNGMPVFLVPITVKNVKGETHGLNMFYYTQYGSKGTTLDKVGAYFDNEIAYAGNIRSGATLESFMAFLYDGDGDYYVEFSKPFGEKIEVRLPVRR